MNRWQITAPKTSLVLADAPTEGQAWLQFLEYEGESVDGPKFIEAVGRFKFIGYRAREITNDGQEAYGRER